MLRVAIQDEARSYRSIPGKYKDDSAFAGHVEAINSMLRCVMDMLLLYYSCGVREIILGGRRLSDEGRAASRELQALKAQGRLKDLGQRATVALQ